MREKTKEDITSYLKRQVRQVRKNGLPVFLRKIKVFLLMVSAIPFVLIVRLLRPLVIIRFRSFESDRIGHFAANTEIYLCERDAGMHHQKNFDIFYHEGNICNNQLKKMWNRTLHVYNYARWVDRLNCIFGEHEIHTIPVYDKGDYLGLLSRSQPHLSFTSEEKALGETALKEMGIPQGMPVVCFNSRDSAYLDKERPIRNWDYHSYRDSSVRDYLLAAETLTQRGYYAIRVGSTVKERLITSNSKIIDYSIGHRTDFLDIYLGAKCRFFLGSNGGINSIPLLFRRPIVWVNFIPLGWATNWSVSDLFIPKKLWLSKEQRFLSFREVLHSKIGKFAMSEEYEKAGIEVIENTPEEIRDVVVEMDDRLKDKWQTTKQDEELQRRYWEIIMGEKTDSNFLARFGAKFLRQNQKLLE